MLKRFRDPDGFFTHAKPRLKIAALSMHGREHGPSADSREHGRPSEGDSVVIVQEVDDHREMLLGAIVLRPEHCSLTENVPDRDFQLEAVEVVGLVQCHLAIPSSFRRLPRQPELVGHGNHEGSQTEVVAEPPPQHLGLEQMREGPLSLADRIQDAAKFDSNVDASGEKLGTLGQVRHRHQSLLQSGSGLLERRSTGEPAPSVVSKLDPCLPQFSLHRVVGDRLDVVTQSIGVAHLKGFHDTGMELTASVRRLRKATSRVRACLNVYSRSGNKRDS
jgi:hypothetical protein